MELFLRTKFILLLTLFTKSIICRYSLPIKPAKTVKPHKDLNDKEFNNIFHQSRDKDPDYHFVTIETQRDVNPGQRDVAFVIDGRTYNLKLIPANMSRSVVPYGTPIMEVSTKNNQGYNYKDIHYTDFQFDSSSVFEDFENKAVLLEHMYEFVTYYDGVFGEGKYTRAIRAAPHRLSDTYGTGNHFIYNIHGLEHDAIKHRIDHAHSGNLGSPLKYLYPKILVVVDHSLFQNFQGDHLECLKYLTIFWNAVDMKYRLIRTPKVHVIVTGVIFATDKEALKYVFDARDKTVDQKADVEKLLNDGQLHFKSKHFYDETTFGNFDASITMATLHATQGISGIAYMGGICTDDDNAAFIYDKGNYHGIITGTHELGHLLNMDHVEDTNCKDNTHDTIMGEYTNMRAEKYVWSECSLQALREFAEHTDSKCLSTTSRHRKPAGV